MPERKLASVQKIIDIQDVPNSDFIQVATVLGWKVVVNKNDKFNKGDLCVYIEIDSILPDKPEFEFLRNEKWRIRTRKFRKQISQGIIFPLSILPTNNKWKEGDILDDIIGVRKYDPEGDKEKLEEEKRNSLQKSRIKRYFMRYSLFRRFFIRKKKERFPSLFSKTDEIRIQAIPYVLDNYKGKLFYCSEKIDGTSFSSYVIKINWFFNYFGVCSRNLELPRVDDSVYWRVAVKENIKKKLLEAQKYYKTDLCVQGEICGPGVQENRLKLSEVRLYVFDVFDIHKGEYFSIDEIKKFCNKFKFNSVPILAEYYLLDFNIDSILEYAKGPSVLNKDVPREGLVFREYQNNTRNRCSFKVINNDYLLKYNL